MDEQPKIPRLENPLKTNPDIIHKLGWFITPLSAHGWPVWLIYLLSVIGLIYVLNPGFGVFELIPDNIPIIGNLDEGVAFMLLWFGIVEYFEGKKYQKPDTTDDKDIVPKP